MMKATISNNIIVENYNLNLIDYCQKHLVISNPDYFIAEKMGRYTGNIPKDIYLYETRGNNLVLPFGTLGNVWDIIKDNYTTDFAPNINLSMQGSIKLYPYQEDAVNALKNAKSGILEAPCGSGKTQIGIALIKELGFKALWLTHTGDLLKQSMDRAKEYFDGDFGTITDGKVNIGSDITFATVQTMVKLDLQQYANEFTIVIVDECHRVAGTPTKVMQFYKVLSNLKARYKYGLSATLHRADNMIKSTYAIIGKIVHSISDEQVSSKIMKSQHIAYPTNIADQIERYTDFDGTLNYNKLIAFISEHTFRNDLIASVIKEQVLQRNFNLVLSARVEHLKFLQTLLAKIGVSSELVIGAVDKDKRAEIFQKVRDKQCFVILATYSLAKEGLDIPNLNRLHLITPQKDKAIILQSAGRIERRIDGKTDALIFDYLDSSIPYCMAMFKKRRSILKGRAME